MGLVLVSSEKITIEKSLRLGFSATNNEAEYETLLVGMIVVQKIGGKAVEVVGGKNLSSQLQNATSKFSGKFQINVIKLIKLDDDMCHPNRHHIGISKFATCHLAHRIKINSLFKIYG